MQHIQRCTGVLCLAEIYSGHQKGFTNCDSKVVYNCIHGWHVLRFSSLAVLFSLYLHFMPHLLSQDPSLMPIITIFLSWDPSHSPYAPSNPYTIHCITTRQGIFFLSLLLVMDAYSSSQFSHIHYIFLLLISPSLMFHDLLPLLSRTFYFVP